MQSVPRARDFSATAPPIQAENAEYLALAAALCELARVVARLAVAVASLHTQRSPGVHITIGWPGRA